MNVRTALPAALVLVSACAAAMGASRNEVTIVVRNAQQDGMAVRACGPLACSGFRRLDAGARGTFRLAAGGGSRAVVEGKRGDRFVARQPVDFTPGETVHVELAAGR
jgi:hypothetical protein